MAIIAPGKTLIGNQIRGKLGPRTGYGVRQYGVFYYGEEDPYQGIYRVAKGAKKQIIIKQSFYDRDDEETPAQLAQRQKITDANIAWHNLTDEHKAVYNNKAKGRPLSGYNLFIKQYLLSA